MNKYFKIGDIVKYKIFDGEYGIVFSIDKFRDGTICKNILWLRSEVIMQHSIGYLIKL
jgi:hypothetical protein